MKLVQGITFSLSYFVSSGLLCSLFLTELRGQSDEDEDPIPFCEKYASVTWSTGSEENSSGDDRSDAYAIKAKKWQKTNLTFSIGRYSSRFPRQTQDGVIKKALQKWGDVSCLTFQQVSHRADINVEFVTQLEGDRVASSFYPGTYYNTVRFRESVPWTIDRYGSSRNLNYIATHELGHSLGICHSNVRTAIMYGTYLQARDAEVQLDEDDILAIQRLYGPNPRTGYRPKYDPGPSTDTVGNEAYYSPELGYYVMYIKRGQGWALHRQQGGQWVPLPPNTPRPRNLPEPPPEGYSRRRNNPPVNRGNTPPVNRGNTPPVSRGSTPPVNRGSTPPVNRGSTPPVNRGYNPTVNRRYYNPTVNRGYYNPTVNRGYNPTVNRRHYPRGIRGYQKAESSSSSSAFTSSEEGSSESTTSGESSSGSGETSSEESHLCPMGMNPDAENSPK